MTQKELEDLNEIHPISKEEALKSCRYYHGEEECPLDCTDKLLWDYERIFVQEAQLGPNSNLLIGWCAEYLRVSEDERPNDDRHVYLKALLLNRFDHWMQSPGFVKWYKKCYPDENVMDKIDKRLSMCRYYHDGENQPPQSIVGAQIAIWQSEKTACGFPLFEEDDEVTTESFVRMVVNLIAKWEPYDYWNILEVYKTENPEYKEIIEAEERGL